MKENIVPWEDKPVPPGSLVAAKVLVIGFRYAYDSLVAWLGQKMGFSHENLLYYLECLSPRIDEINPDLIIVINNRLDEIDEGRWWLAEYTRHNGDTYFDTLLNKDGTPYKRLPQDPYYFQNRSLEDFTLLWDFCYKNGSSVLSYPTLNVEFVCGPPPPDGMLPDTECVRLAFDEKGQGFKLKPLVSCIEYFYKKAESYGTFFENNENVPFEHLFNNPCYLSARA